MKDLSFFIFKNALGAKMKKGFRNFCNGDGSTSTLNQQNNKPHNHDDDDDLGDNNSNNNYYYYNNIHGDHDHPSCMFTPSPPPYFNSNNDTGDSAKERQPTLEEMILQLELEEEMAKQQEKLNDYGVVRGRMSCVNSSEILRSARNALNQYPRFSLDGKDAMYRSSFRNLEVRASAGRRSVCCDHGLRERFYEEPSLCLPPSLGGESVIWCEPGVVAKLMGLEAVPVPISGGIKACKNVQEARYPMLERRNLRRRAQRHEMERRLAMQQQQWTNYGDVSGARSRVGKMKPAVAPINDGGRGWPTRRFG